MKSEWKVTANIIDDEVVYGVYRLLDVDEIDHSGNREIYGEYMVSRNAAISIAEVLNELSKDAQ